MEGDRREGIGEGDIRGGIGKGIIGEKFGRGIEEVDCVRHVPRSPDIDGETKVDPHYIRSSDHHYCTSVTL